MITNLLTILCLLLYGNDMFYQNNKTADDNSAFTIVDNLFWSIYGFIIPSEAMNSGYQISSNNM